MKAIKKTQLSLIIASSLCLGLIGCGSDDDGDGGTTVTDPQASLSLAFTALDDLGEDYVYEGWLLVDGTPVSTGRFTSNTADEQMASVADATAATKYILTIEPAVGDVPAPADTHVLAGDIIDSAASLSIADGAALGTDFVNSSGSFITATPTEGPDTFNQGIWWLVPGEPPTASLTLPTLPAGWAYEGWVVVDGTPVSTGTFTDTAAADSDAGGATAGTMAAAPPFPGQDFINPATVITGLAAVISVEPSPDNSPAPFGIKPLVDSFIDNVGAGASQDMENVIGENSPSGTLTITMP